MLSIDNALAFGLAALGGGATEPATPPAAADDMAVVRADGRVVGDLLANDGGRAPLTVTAIEGGAVGQAMTTPAGATLTVGADGAFDYDPAGAFDTLADGAEVEERFRYTLQTADGTAQGALIVRVLGVNAPPERSTAPGAVTISAGAPLELDLGVLFEDPADVLSFAAATAPDWLALDAATGWLTGVAPAEPTTAAFTVTARDTAEQTAAATVTVTVTPPAPQLGETPEPANWRLGAPASLRLADFIVDPAAITTYALAPGSAPLPTGLTLEGATGVIAGTPTEPTLNRAVVVRATSAGGVIDITLDVTTPHPDAARDIGVLTYNAAMTAADLSGDFAFAPTSYLLVGDLPAGLTLNPTTGVVSGAPTEEAPDQTVAVRASDGSQVQTAQVRLMVETHVSAIRKPPAQAFAAPMIYDQAGQLTADGRFDGAARFANDGCYWRYAADGRSIEIVSRGAPAGGASGYCAFGWVVDGDYSGKTLRAQMEIEEVFPGLTRKRAGGAGYTLLVRLRQGEPVASAAYYTIDLLGSGPHVIDRAQAVSHPVVSMTVQFAPVANAATPAIPAGTVLYRIKPPLVGGVRAGTIRLFDPAAQPLLATGRLYDEAAAVGAETYIDVRPGFLGVTSYSIVSGLPAGMTLDADGVIRGSVASAGAHTVTVRGTGTSGTVDDSFALSAQANAQLVPDAVDGPYGAQWMNRSTPEIEPILSTMTRVGRSTRRITAKFGSKARMHWRMRNLTVGAQYALTPQSAAGTLPAGAQMRLSVHRFTAPKAAPDATWTAGQAAPTVTFTADSDAPYITLEADAAAGEYFEVDADLWSVVPVDAVNDAPLTGVRIGTPAAVSGRTAARLFNMTFGRRYRVQATVARGANSAVTLRHAAMPDLSTPPGISGSDPRPAEFDTWTSSSGDLVVDAIVYAQKEIAWLVAEGDVAAPALTVTAVTEQPLGHDALTVDPAARFPYFALFQAPGGGAVRVPEDHPTVAAALAAAHPAGGVTISVADGDHAVPALTQGLRFRSEVVLTSRTRRGARLVGPWEWRDVRNLTLRGFRRHNDFIRLVGVQRIRIEHNLFTGGTPHLLDQDTHDTFGLVVANNDFTGGPIPTITANPSLEFMNLSQSFDVQFMGNRTLWNRQDALKPKGRDWRIERNWFGELYSTGVNGADDHGDHIQVLGPGVRAMDNAVIRGNVFADDVAAQTGDRAALAISHSAGSMTARGLIIDGNLFAAKGSNIALSVNGVQRDLVITNNTVMGGVAGVMLANDRQARFHGRVEGNLSTSIATSGGWTYGTGLIANSDTTGVVIRDNYITGSLPALNAIVADPADPRNHVLSGEPAAATGKGAVALSAALAAEGATPAAPQPGDWTATLDGDVLTVTLRTPPAGAETVIDRVEASVNGGASWATVVGLTPPASLTGTVTGAAGATGADWMLRVVSNGETGAASTPLAPWP